MPIVSDEFDAGAPAPAPTTADAPALTGPVPPASLPPDDLTAVLDHGRALPASHPSDAFVPLRRWALERADQLRVLRGELREQLAASTSGTPSGTPRVHETIVLVTSELATNALAHGRPPAQVRLSLDGRSVLVVVSDGDTTHAPFLAEGRAPGEGGFGLQIARRLSRDVGWWVDATGKHVWAAFDVDASS